MVLRMTLSTNPRMLKRSSCGLILSNFNSFVWLLHCEKAERLGLTNNSITYYKIYFQKYLIKI
jgi:hypothetical protein